jgi:hypothetical protein
MQDIVEKLKSYAGQAGDYLEANPTLAAMLLAGGGAGLLGGYLTSQQSEEESESKMQRRGRILRNALLAAAAGAGTVGLGAAGYKRLAEATPAGSKDPIVEKLTSPVSRGAGAVGLGALGLVKGMGMDDLVTANEARSFLSHADQLQSKGSTTDEIITLAKSKGFSPKPSGFVNPAINSSPLLDKALKLLVGTSRGGQLARLGGGAGLLIPEIIGGAKDLALQE